MSFSNAYSPEQRGESKLKHFSGIFRRAVRKAVISALPGRLILLASLAAGLSFCLVYQEQLNPFPVTIACTVMLLCLAGLHLVMRSTKSLETIGALLFLSAMTFSLPMVVIALLENHNLLTRMSFALTVFCVVGFLPIITFRQFVLTAGFGLAPILLFGLNQELFFVIAVAPWFVLSIRNGVALGVERVLSSAALSVLRLREELHEELIKEYMLEGLHLIFRIQRIGYAEKGANVLLYNHDEQSWSSRPHSPLSELSPLIWSLDGEAGIIKASKFGVDVSERLRAVFGVLTNSIAFYSFGFSGSQKQFRVFFPLSYVHWIIGRSYGFQLVLLYLLVLSQNLEQSLAREFGSTKFRATSDALEREQADLNYIVHLVNNVTQEVSSECSDSILGTAQDIQLMTTDALYALASEVSEFRLARELDSLISQRTPNRIYVNEFRHSFDRYVRALSKRFNVQVESGLSDGEANEVFYEDDVLLLFLMRTLARILISQAVSSATFFVKEQRSPGRWRLDFGIRELKESHAGSHSLSRKRMSSVELKVLGLLQKLRDAVPSLQVSFMEGGSGIPLDSVRFQSFSLEVDVSAYDARSWSPGSQKVLFVDDNQQILGLYQRIAGALKLQSWSAASVGEALQVFERHGPPSVLVIDLQLPDGTGQDLVTRLGLASIPSIGVLVVSGEEREAFLPIEESLGSDRVRFLSKPISQQLLVRSIKELLERF